MRMLVLLAFLLILPVATSEAQERRLTSDPTAGGVAAYGGKAVWSRYDSAGKVHLVESTTDGPRDLPVAPSDVPFETGIGPGSDGAPVAVYVRCVEGIYCDVHRFDFASRRESRVKGISSSRCSATEPSIWQGRVAFVRRSFVPHCVGGLYVREPNGDVRRLVHDGPGARRLVYDPDLRGGWLAYGAAGDYGATSEVHVMRLRDARSRLVVKAKGDRYLYPLAGPVPPDRPRGEGFSVSAPKLYGRHVYWVREDIARAVFALGRSLRVRGSPKAYAPLPRWATLSGGRLHINDDHGLAELPIPQFPRR